MKNKENKNLLFRFCELIGTFFYVGKSPIIPGTVGTIAGMMLILWIFYQPYDFSIKDGEFFYAVGGGFINSEYILHILIILSAFFQIIGHYTSDIYSKISGIGDPKEIVIDEVAGIFTTCTLISLFLGTLIYYWPEEFILYMSLSGYFFVVAFILFRFFDMVKPWPVSWIDQNIKGGKGIMLDDQVAGLLAAIVFCAGFYILHVFDALNKYISV